MIVKLDAKRRLSIPSALAPTRPGDRFEARFDADEDTVIFRRIPSGKSWLEIMKRCPVPMDDLPPRSRELGRKPKL